MSDIHRAARLAELQEYVARARRRSRPIRRPAPQVMIRPSEDRRG